MPSRQNHLISKRNAFEKPLYFKLKTVSINHSQSHTVTKGARTLCLFEPPIDLRLSHLLMPLPHSSILRRERRCRRREIYIQNQDATARYSFVKIITWFLQAHLSPTPKHAVQCGVWGMGLSVRYSCCGTLWRSIQRCTSGRPSPRCSAKRAS